MLKTSDTLTASQPDLRFVPAPMPYERRRSPRREFTSAAQAVHFVVPHGYQLLRLELRDVSDSGFRASSPEPLAPGTMIRVRVAPNSPLHQATVVRCRPDGGKFEVGCRIAYPLAA